MIFLTEKRRNRNRIDVVVYDSLRDLAQRVDWQDILDESLRILDEEGNLYVWDDSKRNEVGTVFGYSFKKNGVDLELLKKCKDKFIYLGQPDSCHGDFMHCSQLPYDDWRWRKEVDVNRNAMERHIGFYSSGKSQIEIKLMDDGLYALANGQLELRLFPEGDNEYYFRDFNTTFKFNGSTLTVHEHGQDTKWIKRD